MDDVNKACSEIADLAEGLRRVLGDILDGQSEVMIVDLTLKRIIELADQFV